MYHVRIEKGDSNCLCESGKWAMCEINATMLTYWNKFSMTAMSPGSKSEITKFDIIAYESNESYKRNEVFSWKIEFERIYIEKLYLLYNKARIFWSRLRFWVKIVVTQLITGTVRWNSNNLIWTIWKYKQKNLQKLQKNEVYISQIQEETRNQMTGGFQEQIN